MTRMCKKLALTGALALLLFVPAAFADTLKYTDNAQVTGMIEGVNFVTGGLPNFYTRDNITAIELTEEGKDTLTVGDGGKREGKLVSVRMKTGDGLVSVARKQLSAIEMKVEQIEEKPADTQADTKPEATLSPEQKTALAKNRDLKADYTKQAGEELKKFGEKQTAWKAACDEVLQLQKSIDNKIQARQNRENQPQQRTTYTDSSGRTRTRETNNNNNFNDGLDRDQRSLEKAQDKQSAMERDLRAEKTKIENRVREKEKGVQRAYDEFRKAIVANNIPSEEAMILKYKVAIAVGGPADAKKGPKAAAAKMEKQAQAAAEE